MDVRRQAAERILNRGVRFRLPAPFFSRLFRLDHIIIKPLKPGTILEFATIVLEHDLEEALTLSDYQILKKSIGPIARCVAVSILNNELKIAKRLDKLQRWLLWKVDPQLLIKIFLTIERMNRTSDFTNITRFYVIQTSMMMNPNLGQENDGR